MKKNIFILSILVLFACKSESENPLVRGRVRDSNGSPVSQVKIVISLDMLTNQGNYSICYSFGHPMHVLLWVGAECDDDTVKILVDEIQQPGYHSINWDGLNNDSLIIPNGLYTYHLISDSTSNYSHFISAGDYNNYSYSNIEPLAMTDEDGYFEFNQECLPFDHEQNRFDEQGNIVGTWRLSRSVVVRAFHPDHNRIYSDTLSVDKDEGLEVNLQFYD